MNGSHVRNLFLIYAFALFAFGSGSLLAKPRHQESNAEFRRSKSRMEEVATKADLDANFEFEWGDVGQYNPVDEKAMRYVELPDVSDPQTVVIMPAKSAGPAWPLFHTAMRENGADANLIQATSPLKAAEGIADYVNETGEKHIENLVIAGFGSNGMLSLGKQGSKAGSWMTANSRATKDFIRYLNEEGISVAHITILGYRTVDGMKVDAPHLVKTLARDLDSKPDVTAYEGTGYFGSSKKAPFSVDKPGFLTIRAGDASSEELEE